MSRRAAGRAHYATDPDPPQAAARGPNRRAGTRGGAREPVPAANYGEALAGILAALDDVRAGLGALCRLNGLELRNGTTFVPAPKRRR